MLLRFNPFLSLILKYGWIVKPQLNRCLEVHRVCGSWQCWCMGLLKVMAFELVLNKDLCSLCWNGDLCQIHVEGGFGRVDRAMLPPGVQVCLLSFRKCCLNVLSESVRSASLCEWDHPQLDLLFYGLHFLRRISNNLEFEHCEQTNKRDRAEHRQPPIPSPMH